MHCLRTKIAQEESEGKRFLLQPGGDLVKAIIGKGNTLTMSKEEALTIPQYFLEETQEERQLEEDLAKAVQ